MHTVFTTTSFCLIVLIAGIGISISIISVNVSVSIMSKLSPSLKALINAPMAAPHPTPATARIADAYKAIARDAARRGLGLKPWVTLSVRFLPNKPPFCGT